MCTILMAYKMHEHYDLIVAANRDEFFERPTREAHFWESHAGVLAGRDLKACGTWLGVHKSGRFGALTNYRDFRMSRDHKASRGEIVLNYLMSQNDTVDYLEELKQNTGNYDPYNGVFYDQRTLYYLNNITGRYHEVEPGFHGLSNAFLDTPWYKVRKGRRKLQELVKESDGMLPWDLFDLLDDVEKAPDIELPDTGIGQELEKTLSSLHIETETYGTRYKSVVLIAKDGSVTFYERYLDHETGHWYQHQFEI